MLMRQKILTLTPCYLLSLSVGFNCCLASGKYCVYVGGLWKLKLGELNAQIISSVQYPEIWAEHTHGGRNDAKRVIRRLFVED